MSNHSKIIDGLVFRKLLETDIPFGMELKNFAKWNQIEADWKRFILYEPDGCFVAMYNGEPVGTVTTINYEKRFGWIGMVLVHPQKRRLGIGTALLCKAIDYLKEIGVETIKLDATPEGKNVYIPLGFLEEFDLNRRQGMGITIDCVEFPLIKVEDLQDIIRFDAKIFGAEREIVIKNLVQENPDTSFIAKNHEGQIEGYIIARKGLNACQIGPWISKSSSLAEELFVLMLKKLSGKRIFLDVPCENEKGVEIVEKYGFTIQRGFTRMFFGSNAYPGTPLYIYATSGAEKG
jgi:ribosomal protein S18 acetylase RimI-like enzyme